MSGSFKADETCCVGILWRGDDKVILRWRRFVFAGERWLCGGCRDDPVEVFLVKVTLWGHIGKFSRRLKS